MEFYNWIILSIQEIIVEKLPLMVIATKIIFFDFCAPDPGTNNEKMIKLFKDNRVWTGDYQYLSKSYPFKLYIKKSPSHVDTVAALIEASGGGPLNHMNVKGQSRDSPFVQSHDWSGKDCHIEEANIIVALIQWSSTQANLYSSVCDRVLWERCYCLPNHTQSLKNIPNTAGHWLVCSRSCKLCNTRGFLGLQRSSPLVSGWILYSANVST